METPPQQAGTRGASPWLTTRAAAEYLGCTAGTLKTWRAAGAGPRYHGRHRFVRYNVADLDAFVLNGGSRSEPG
jgi:hypothetical protein